MVKAISLRVIEEIWEFYNSPIGRAYSTRGIARKFKVSYASARTLTRVRRERGVCSNWEYQKLLIDGREKREPYFSFGVAVRGGMEATGKRVPNLADEVGVTNPTVRRWKYGQSLPRDQQVLQKLFRALHINDPALEERIAKESYVWNAERGAERERA